MICCSTSTPETPGKPCPYVGCSEVNALTISGCETVGLTKGVFLDLVTLEAITFFVVFGLVLFRTKVLRCSCVAGFDSSTIGGSHVNLPGGKAGGGTKLSSCRYQAAAVLEFKPHLPSTLRLPSNF